MHRPLDRRTHDVVHRHPWPATRQGLTLSTGMLSLVLAQNAAQAEVPAPLAFTTWKGAMLFAQRAPVDLMRSLS